jgi:hypothetical protein
MNRPAGLMVAVLVLLAGCWNEPPSPPMMNGPLFAQRGESTWFYAYSYDPDSDSLSYRFQWGDGTETEWLGLFPSGTDCAASHLYGDTGTFGVRAKSKDVRHETGWSETLFVRVGEYGPFVPHRPSGPDTVPVSDSTSFITSAGHPLQKKVAFQFDWGDTTGDWSEFVRPGELFVARHAFTRGGVFAVRARAKDTLEHVTDWSKDDTVVVIDTFRIR